LREGLEDISYSPFETTQLFKQLETLHLARLRSVPKIDAVAPLSSPKVQVALVNSSEASANLVRPKAVDAPSPDTQVKSTAPELKPVAAEVTSVPLQGDSANDSHSSDVVATAAVKVTEAAATNVANVATDASVELVAPEAEPVITAVEPLVPVGASLESLDTFVVVNEEPPVVVAENSLPDGDQHLALVGNITQGSWFEMQTEDGQKFRSRLAAIIRATGKYIFVNRSGVKVAEETRMTLALALKSGRMQLLDDGMLFDRALEAVIGNLRNNR
jgi:hypothetical protein